MTTNIRMEAFTGFYSGMWDRDHFFDNAMDNLENDYGSIEYKWDWEFSDQIEWERHFSIEYATAFFDLIEQHLGIKFNVVSTSVWSPKEYNFATDQIDCEVEITDEKWRDKLVVIADSNREELSKIIKDNHTSYDGFWSFMKNDIGSWRDIISGKTEGVDDMLYVSYLLLYLLAIKSETDQRQINEAIACYMEDDIEIWYPDLKPGTKEAEEEWDRLKQEYEDKMKRLAIFNACPCLPGLEDYQ